MDVCLMSPGLIHHFAMLAAKTFGFDSAQMLLLAMGVGILAVVMVSTRNRIRRSQASSRPSALDRYADLREQRGAARDLETVMKELDELSRQIHGRLDTKLAKLEVLIGDADRRIEKLARLQRAAAGEPTVDVTLEPEVPCPSRDLPLTPAAPDPHEAVYRLADSGLKPVEIARELSRNTGEIELILSLRRVKGRAGYVGDLSGTPQPTPL